LLDKITTIATVAGGFSFPIRNARELQPLTNAVNKEIEATDLQNF